MRILFFPQSLGHGGPEQLISYLVQGLAQRGHHVAVATLHTIAEGWEEILDPSTVPITIFFPETPGTALSAAHQLVSAVHALRRLLRAEEIDCIYCTAGPVPPVVGWLASFNLASVQVVWSLLAMPFRSTVHQGWRSRLLRQLRTWMSPTVPLFISCSGAVQMGARTAGYHCKRHAVIYNSVDTERFQPNAATRAAIRSEWGISPADKLVGLVGRLDPVKGHRVFLEAARIMTSQRNDLRFVCVGDGPEPYRGQLHRLGAELGLGERLIWAGEQTYGDMPAVFNALDILCLSSYSEGLPSVLLEAMACGVPCVATSVGGVPEVMGDLGITVPPGDPMALAQGVWATLLAEPRPEVLRRRVIDLFSVETMVTATERELKALLGHEE